MSSGGYQEYWRRTIILDPTLGRGSTECNTEAYEQVYCYWYVQTTVQIDNFGTLEKTTDTTITPEL